MPRGPDVGRRLIGIERVVVAAVVGALAVTTITTLALLAPTTEDRVAAAPGTTAYEPVQPCRLSDTRTGEGFAAVNGRTLRIGLDRCAIPDDAVAIVATTTIINAPTNGYLVMYPTGTPTPDAATLTWNAGSTRGNAATIRVGDDGTGRSVELFRPDGFVAGDVTIDVIGAFVPAETAASGRFVPDADGRRLLDTRDTGRVGSGDTVEIPIPDGVPPDATALAITVTVAETDGRGFFTAYPSRTERPTVSMLNVEARGQFRSASTFVPVDEGGFRLFADTGAHLIVDMTGWFTGEGAEVDDAGLFVPITPTRLADTRPEPRPVHPGGTIEVPLPVDLTDGVQPSAPASAVVSLTMIDPDVRGFVTTHGSRTPRGNIASGYALHGEVAAQFATTAVSPAGVAVYSENGTELTVDLLGWFTGDSTPVTTAAPVNPVPRQRVLAIGDSSMAGVERTNALSALQGASFDFRARSCRRLVRISCSGREGPIPPPTALDTLNTIPEDAYDILIVMTGYNDTMPQFTTDVPRIVERARAKGFRRIIWLTMAREFRHEKGGADAFQVYHEHNRVIRANAAAHDFMIAPEWASIIRQVPWWTYADGIHLDRPGGFGAADLMSRAVAHVSGQPCPQPEVPGGETTGVCPEPGSRPPVDVAALYGF